MEKIKDFLDRYNITTHSIVASIAVLVSMYYAIPQLHDYVFHIFTILPAPVKNLVVVIVACVAWYWRGRVIWTPQKREQEKAKLDVDKG